MNEADLLLKINEIYRTKQWDKYDSNEYLLDSLVSLTSTINKNNKREQLDLIFELIIRFEWITIDRYDQLLKDIIRKILDNLDVNTDFVINIFAIRKLRHTNQTKSGDFIAYYIKGLIPRLANKLVIKTRIINSYEELKNLKLKKNCIVLLVDDFIGSGETVEECLDEIESYSYGKIETKEMKKYFKILTLAIQTESLKNIRKYGYEILFGIEHFRGISDFNITDSDIIRKKEIMISLEIEMLKARSSYLSMYSLGYKKSECLIALNRTPDNTFPIFWSAYKKKYNFNPPFFRDE